MCVLQPTRCRNRWRNGSGFSAKTAPPATIYSGEHAVAERRCLLTRNRRFAGDLSKLLLDRANIYEWLASGFPSNCTRQNRRRRAFSYLQHRRQREDEC